MPRVKVYCNKLLKKMNFFSLAKFAETILSQKS